MYEQNHKMTTLIPNKGYTGDAGTCVDTRTESERY